MLKRIVSVVIVGLIILSMMSVAFHIPILNVATVKADAIDWWPTFHHDASRAGYTTSPGPNAGTVRWQYPQGYVMDSGPAVADGKVYATFAHPGILCLDATLGRLIWSRAVGDVYSSPTVADGRVYVVSSGVQILYCLNASTGTSLWNYTTSGGGGGVIDSSPAVVNGLLYVGASDGNVYCLNASSGARIWSYPTGSLVDSSPAVVNGMVYVGSDDDNVYCLNASTGALIWSYATGNSVDSSPAVVNGMLYVGSMASVYCLNASNGALNWTYTSYGAYFRSSPAVAYDSVYVGSYDGTYCLSASSGALLWRHNTGGVLSSPAVAGGNVYVSEATNYNVYCLSASTGTPIWNYKTKGPIYSSPAVVNGMVYVGSNDGHLYCIGQSSYTVEIHGYDSTLGGDPNVPVAMDGSSTGQNTPCQFPGLTGTHTFGVPSTDSEGHPFLDWNTGQTTPTITVPVADGYYVAYYQAAAPPLSASASGIPLGGNAPLTVQFTGSALGGQAPYSYSWTFGDGGSSGQQNPSYTYQNQGTYTATLTVTDSQNNKATSPVTITVSPPQQALSAFASASPTSGIAPLMVQFTGSASGGQTPYSYSWTFGDGSTSNQQSPSHTYQSQGSYSATLTVTDSASHTATSSVPITVGMPVTYGVTIKAHCNTEGTDVGVLVTEDGSVTGLDTPFTFPGLTGVHNFTVPAFDANYHPFKQWDIGETTTTITVSGGGTHTADYQAVPYPPTAVTATPLNNAIKVSWLNPATGYQVNQYYVYRSTTPNFVPWFMAPCATVNGNTFNHMDIISDNTIYYYQVVANFTQGCSIPSAIVSCERLESVKGIENTITGVNSLTLNTNEPLEFTLQQNFYVFSGNEDSQGRPIVYWVQNCMDINLLTWSEAKMFVFSYSWDTGAKDGPIYFSPYFFLLKAYLPDTCYFESSINGQWISLDNSIGSWPIDLHLSNNAYISTIPPSAPPNLIEYPSFCIVGPHNQGIVFYGGQGSVSFETEIGTIWIPARSSQLVPDNNASSTYETSTGLQWNDLTTAANYYYQSGAMDWKGVYFLPDFNVQKSQAVSFNVLGTAKRTVVLSLDCPAYLDLFDNQGRDVGYNTTSGTIDFQISNVVWESNQTLLIFDPSGNYSVEVTGTDNGTYELQTSWDDLTGTTVTLLDSNNIITAHETQTYLIGVDANLTLTDLSSSKSVIGRGLDAEIIATVADLGAPDSTCNVTLYANGTIIGTQGMLNVSGWSSSNACFTWNTTGFAYGNYSINAMIDGTNNTLACGWITVAGPGDLTGGTSNSLDFVPDGKVDMKDIGVVARFFGQAVPNAPSNCDITGLTLGVPDGIVDMRDIGTVARHFGQTYSYQ